jgi:hypothetical protein
VTSGLRRDIDEICALLGCYAAQSGNSLTTFRDNIFAPSLRVKKSKKAPRRLKEDRRSQVLRSSWHVIAEVRCHYTLLSFFASSCFLSLCPSLSARCLPDTTKLSCCGQNETPYFCLRPPVSYVSVWQLIRIPQVHVRQPETGSVSYQFCVDKSIYFLKVLWMFMQQYMIVFCDRTQVGNYRKFRNQELQEWCFAANVVREIESKKRRGAGCGVCIGGTRNPYEISVTKLESRNHCGDLDNETKIPYCSWHHAATAYLRLNGLQNPVDYVEPFD